MRIDWLWLGGEGPGDLPHWAYQHLVLVSKIDPDLLSGMKCVQQLGFFRGSLATLIRIFNPEHGEGKIKDFASLNHYPELILYEGYQEAKTGKIDIFKGLGRPTEGKIGDP